MSFTWRGEVSCGSRSSGMTRLRVPWGLAEAWESGDSTTCRSRTHQARDHGLPGPSSLETPLGREPHSGFGMGRV